ncbi:MULTISPECIES: hypothetical protein [unclassified Saccharopolyspora]|uniref:hypothetical protein n=1 Tax=unclassified Saccharopolyspora TaxID=2646250 RepID=UPI001CD6BD55|nr:MULTISPECIES: hypothetical protein [unclassified Saccharopolyspora]MCA1189536.1 hypothetical protein [Saccharopolyspora sp. 6T]MCA1195493.1 hypothetical protein [Saccharopolyspora sp. 6V]MCA1228956.1 hypothetical protein [Saccharopolyspora sp. 6M]MCA1282332.1 hypothetical protein [Saccharopolyspora sp. 7B]
MATDIVHDGIRHCGKVSPWDSLATSLCGKAFLDKTYAETMFSGMPTCPDCVAAKRSGKKR